MLNIHTSVRKADMGTYVKEVALAWLIANCRKTGAALRKRRSVVASDTRTKGGFGPKE